MGGAAGGVGRLSCVNVLGEELLLDGETRRTLLRDLQRQDQELSLTLLRHLVGAVAGDGV